MAEAERAGIVARFGAGAVVWDEQWQVSRTSAAGGRCFFLREQGCLIYHEPFYPRLCRGLPWTEGDASQPYRWPVDICPELPARPEFAPFPDEAKVYLWNAPPPSECPAAVDTAEDSQYHDADARAAMAKGLRLLATYVEGACGCVANLLLVLCPGPTASAKMLALCHDAAAPCGAAGALSLLP